MKSETEENSIPDDDKTTGSNDSTIETRALAISAKKLHENLSYVLVRIIDARSPFPLLAFFKLAALPRNGDIVNIQTSTGIVGYKVEFIYFNPLQEYQVTIGCLPPEAASVSGGVAPTELKERMENVVKSQLQIFERAQAFSNAIIVAGYAGIFGLWSLTKENLSKSAVSVVALLIGASLLIYVTWEIYGMVLRANSAFRFQKLIGKQPSEFFKLAIDYEADQRTIGAGAIIVWRFTVVPAVFLAYFGAGILIYNFAAALVGLPQWP